MAVHERRVDVVPCDDAAVERVATRLANEYMGGWVLLDAIQKDDIREAAAALLSAAGETP